MIHGALAIPDRTDGDEVVFTREEIAASGLDYLALGHWHSYQQAVAGGTTYAYSGAPEPVAISQDGAGNVVLVELETTAGGRTVTATPRTVGKTRFQKLDLDAAAIADQPALVGQLSALADPDLVLDVRLTGVRPDELDLDPEEVEGQLKGSVPPDPPPRRVAAGADAGVLPVARHDPRRVHPERRGPDRRARGGSDPATTTRPRSSATSSASGRLLLAGPRGDPVRITRLVLRDFRRYREIEIPLSPGPDDRPRPERGRQDDDPAGDRAGPDPQGDERRGRHGRPSPVGRPGGRPAGRGRSTSRSRTTTAAPGPGRSRRPSAARGDRPPRGRRRDDHRPDARRPGARRADRHPERGLLPLDGVASATRSWPISIATRPRSTIGSRRRSAARTGAPPRPKRTLEKALYELNTKGDKNPGRLKVADEAVAGAEAAVEQGELALAQLERDRDTLAGAREQRAETEAALVERRSLLEQARHAERLIRGAGELAGAVRALPPGRDRRRRAGRPPDDPSIDEPAARPRADRQPAADPRREDHGAEGGPVRRDRGLLRGPAATVLAARPAGRDRAPRPRAPRRRRIVRARDGGRPGPRSGADPHRRRRRR